MTLNAFALNVRALNAGVLGADAAILFGAYDVIDRSVPCYAFRDMTIPAYEMRDKSVPRYSLTDRTEP